MLDEPLSGDRDDTVAAAARDGQGRGRRGRRVRRRRHQPRRRGRLARRPARRRLDRHQQRVPASVGRRRGRYAAGTRGRRRCRPRRRRPAGQADRAAASPRAAASSTTSRSSTWPSSTSASSARAPCGTRERSAGCWRRSPRRRRPGCPGIAGRAHPVDRWIGGGVEVVLGPGGRRVRTQLSPGSFADIGIASCAPVEPARAGDVGRPRGARPRRRAHPRPATPATGVTMSLERRPDGRSTSNAALWPPLATGTSTSTGEEDAMATEFTMPKLGLTMEEGTIIEWLVPRRRRRRPTGPPCSSCRPTRSRPRSTPSAPAACTSSATVGATFACGERIGWLLAEGEARTVGGRTGRRRAAGPRQGCRAPSAAPTPAAATIGVGDGRPAPGVARTPSRLAAERGIDLPRVRGHRARRPHRVRGPRRRAPPPPSAAPAASGASHARRCRRAGDVRRPGPRRPARRRHRRRRARPSRRPRHP